MYICAAESPPFQGMLSSAVSLPAGNVSALAVARDATSGWLGWNHSQSGISRICPYQSMTAAVRKSVLQLPRILFCPMDDPPPHIRSTRLHDPSPARLLSAVDIDTHVRPSVRTVTAEHAPVWAVPLSPPPPPLPRSAVKRVCCGCGCSCSCS